MRKLAAMLLSIAAALRRSLAVLLRRLGAWARTPARAPAAPFRRRMVPAEPVVGAPTPANLFRKRVLKQVPVFRPDDYAAIKARYRYDYTFPQAFFIDWSTDELFILRAPSSGANDWNWVEVYRWSTDAYLGTFSAGNAVGEGLEIMREGDRRFLWARAGTDLIGKFDITRLPANQTRIEPVSTRHADYYLDFSFHGGVALVEQRSKPGGGRPRRSHFHTFRLEDWAPLGEIDFGAQESGLGTLVGQSAAIDAVPKRQGIVMTDHFYAAMFGANYPAGTPLLPIQYTGPKLFGLDGRKIADGLMDPRIAIRILEADGIRCSRLEAEGAVFTPENRLISLYATLGRVDPEAATQGIVFLEEFSTDPKALDFSAAAVPDAPSAADRPLAAATPG